jgi:protein phosphatase 2C family protein 2/3
LGGSSGRIILLGDGTEVLTDSDEQDNYGEDEDDDDLKNQPPSSKQETLSNEKADFRHEREDTPGPEGRATGKDGSDSAVHPATTAAKDKS